MNKNNSLYHLVENMEKRHKEENDKIKDLLNRFSLEDLRIVKNFCDHFFFSKEQFQEDLKQYNKFNGQYGENAETDEYPFGWIGLGEEDCSLKMKYRLLDLDILLATIFQLKSIKGEQK